MTSDKNYSNRSQTWTIRIDKKKKQPLGLTLEKDEFNQFRVARIIAGGAVDKSYRSAIKEGDIILEINKKTFDSVDDFQDLIVDQSIIHLKIGSAIDEKLERLTNEINNMNLNKKSDKQFVCYMRALFNYDPSEDSLLPCKDIGLEFSIGDILQIVDKSDPNWWQARKVNNNERAGLIPSQELEERRKAFVDPEADFVHSIGICGTRVARKKKKITYTSKNSDLYDKAELLCYEEVARMPPFRRKTLVLIGPQGVGKRTLKQKIINSDPNKFGSALPHTTRPQRALEDNGVNYWFIDQETMEKDIREHKFLEYGQLNGYIYGTHLDTIRDIFKQGKMCVLDCSPSALKIMHNSSEFLPYVIFIAAPGIRQLANFYDNNRFSNGGTFSSRTLNQFERQSSIRYSSRRARTLESLASLYEEEDLQKTIEESACMQRTYEKYIDLVIVNDDMDTSYTKILESLDSLQTLHQWIPVNWIY